MEISKGPKKQSIEDLFRDTFDEAISFVGSQNVFFCGKKMYIRYYSVIFSVEFTGLEKVYNQLDLRVINKYGTLDANTAPLFTIIRDTKDSQGQEKVVNIKQVSAATGEYTAVWQGKGLTEVDKSMLNEFIIRYIEIFSFLAIEGYDDKADDAGDNKK